MNKQETKAWREIELYNSGKSDLATTILSLFEGELPIHIVEWLNDDKERSQKNIAEAISKGVN